MPSSPCITCSEPIPQSSGDRCVGTYTVYLIQHDHEMMMTSRLFFFEDFAKNNAVMDAIVMAARVSGAGVPLEKRRHATAPFAWGMCM